jgi:hypothetical protein
VNLEKRLNDGTQVKFHDAVDQIKDRGHQISLVVIVTSHTEQDSLANESDTVLDTRLTSKRLGTVGRRYLPVNKQKVSELLTRESVQQERRESKGIRVAKRKEFRSQSEKNDMRRSTTVIGAFIFANVKRERYKTTSCVKCNYSGVIF